MLPCYSRPLRPLNESLRDLFGSSSSTVRRRRHEENSPGLRDLSKEGGPTEEGPIRSEAEEVLTKVQGSCALAPGASIKSACAVNSSR